MPVSDLARGDALKAVTHLVESPGPSLVVTPNTDHFIRFQRDALFRALYRRASLFVVDGAPILWMTRLLGFRSAERFPGVDLFQALLALDDRPQLRIFVIGSRTETCSRAAQIIHEQYRRATVVGHAS